MPLKYHQPTVDLIVNTPTLTINHQPEPSQKNIAWLREKEKKYDIRIPASIAEWFRLNLPWDMGEVLQTREIMPLSEMEFLDPLQTDIKLWYIMNAEYLSQGGVNLFFQITENDDPPVYAWYEEKPIKIAKKFSEFLYIHFWDSHRQNLHKYRVSMYNHPEIRALQVPAKYYVPLDKLRLRYNELSSLTRLHFFDDYSSLWSHKPLSEYGEFIENNEIINQIHIMTDTIEVMEETINYLWDDYPPAFRLREVGGEEQKLLRALQKKQAIKVFQSSSDWLVESELASQLGATIPILSYPMVEVLTSLTNEGIIEMKLENNIKHYRLKDNLHLSLEG
jgi:hypothetical protein